MEWADSDEPGAVRADRRAPGRRSGIGVENGARWARTKDGAGGGPAEEQTRARGCSRSGSPGLGCEDGMTFFL